MLANHPASFHILFSTTYYLPHSTKKEDAVLNIGRPCLRDSDGQCSGCRHMRSHLHSGSRRQSTGFHMQCVLRNCQSHCQVGNCMRRGCWSRIGMLLPQRRMWQHQNIRFHCELLSCGLNRSFGTKKCGKSISEVRYIYSLYVPMIKPLKGIVTHSHTDFPALLAILPALIIFGFSKRRLP